MSASKAENEKLIASTTNPDYAKTLEQANSKLNNLDNNGYQNVLEDFINGSETKIKQIIKDLASASFLQAKNSFITVQFEKALSQINVAIMNDSNNAQYISLKSQIFYSLYNSDSTVYYSNLVLKILSPLDEDSRMLIARANDYLGLTLLEDNKYDAALVYFKKSLTMITRKNNSYLSILYNNIAGCYKKKQLYDSALNYYNKSYSILNIFHSESYPDVISHFNKMGSVYHDIFKISRRSEHFDIAISYYQKSIDLCKKYYEQRNPELGQSYSDLGVLHYDIRQYNEAIKYGLMAVTILENIFGKNCREASDTYGNIGQTYLSVLNYGESIKFFLLKYNVQKKTQKQSHYETKNTAASLYIAYLLNGEENKGNDFVKEINFTKTDKFNIIASSEYILKTKAIL